MIITIFGFTGSGKTTVGELVAKKLRYKHVSPTFKDLAKKEGIDIIEFQEKAKNDPSIDKKFDNLLKEMVASNNAVVTTWLGPWILNPDFKIKLTASEETRAKRVAKREKISLKEAKEYVAKKDMQNVERYSEIYGININDDSIFDIIINTENKSPEEIADKIVEVILNGREESNLNKRQEERGRSYSY